MAELTPQEFVEKWKNASINERQAAQHHFIDLCKLVGHEPPPPSGMTRDGKQFMFEKSLKQDSGRQGYADVYYEDHFAVEYKATGKDLNAAYQQLKQYRENLKNPPLLVVSDIQNWIIHTNFTGKETRVIPIKLEDIPNNLKILRQLFENPYKFGGRTTEEVTVEAAASFKDIVDNMRQEWQADAERIAHFMTRLVFCLFAEDVNLLPHMQQERGLFSHIIEETRFDPTPERFMRYIRELFQQMADGGEMFMQTIRYFNGALFDDIQVEPLGQQARSKLADASRLNWASIEPSIFGTLFERSLDPSKRAQLGAHYTSRDDILLIVEPVLMQPLRREWERIKQAAAPFRASLDSATTPRARTTAQNQLISLREQMLAQLRSVKVLDPACGSGNFLYVSLGLLLDLEKEVINHPLWAGLTHPLPEVHPRQLFGIEKDEIAHALASIVVWIGYIQWKQNNGYLNFHEPILENLQNNILNMDAILAFDAQGNPIEPEWPAVDVIVGNPPFLGGNKMRSELGNEYVDTLRDFYAGQVPGGVDLVTYWFERARYQIEHQKVKRVGLLATNSIRGGSNRVVLDNIKQYGDIFMAWSDRDWILDGASVRVSMIAFDSGIEDSRSLDGFPVTIINSDLTATVDITKAKMLTENRNLAFQGPVKVGAFDFSGDVARKMLSEANPTGVSNADVIKPYINGIDIARKNRDWWIIDFGTMALEEAQSYEAPFRYVEENVKPVRLENNDVQRRTYWWRLGRSGEEYRNAIKGLTRQIFTPQVSKHRVFTWHSVNDMPALIIAFAREDDYFFGVLHSKIHEVWSLRMGTSLEDRPRYTPTTTFETFPFPWPPTHEPASDSVGADVKDGAVHPGISETPDSPSVIRPGSLSTSDAPVDAPDSRPGKSSLTGTNAAIHADAGNFSRAGENQGGLRAHQIIPENSDSDAAPLKSAPTQLYHAIAHAARCLHDERHAWLNPVGIPESQLKDRTLTNLYNALNVFRGQEKIAVKKDAGDFAPRLDELHRALDAAVCMAYGWDPAILDDDEAILRELLALNLRRAES